MAAAKPVGDKPVNLRDGFVGIQVLRDVARVVPILEKQPLTFFCFDSTDRNFLQMRFGTLIIAQSQFYELASRKAPGYFLDEFGDSV